jgi:hypothetical protein
VATDAFDPTKINTEAQHWIRWRLGDTKTPGRVLAKQDTIIAILAIHGLIATSDPVVNRSLVRKAAIDVCRGIVATLSQDSEVAMTDVGPMKKLGAEEMRKVMEDLLREESINARPKYANPGDYPPGFLADVDELPDLE